MNSWKGSESDQGGEEGGGFREKKGGGGRTLNAVPKSNTQGQMNISRPL